MTKNKQNKIELELLAPAKDLNTGKMAVLAGADAVYIGGPQFGARTAAGNSWQDIEELVRFAHQCYVKIYLPLNTIFFDEEAEAVKKDIYKAYAIGVDAIIIQDMGIMEMDLPPILIFASTQTNNQDVEQVKFLEKAGFSRVILARECSLEQIKKIKKGTRVDLETFVHGALCVSFSGRCYFSQSLCQRSANRGECIQACRLPFSLVNEKGIELVKDKFLLSLKDLSLSDSLQELINAGITSFKIEGRLKNEIYVGNVVAKYRQELDKIIAENSDKYKKASSGKTSLSFEPDLEKTFNRGYTKYFLSGREKDIISLDSQKSLGKFIGKVKEIERDYFVLDHENDLDRADGLCWFDEKNNLVGTNINLVEGGRIYPNKWPWLKPGTDIYRNLDTNFEKKISNGAERRIAVCFTIEETEKGFSLSVKDEDNNKAEIEFDYEKKLALKPELVEKNWKQQFSRLGDTVFFAKDFFFFLNKPYFIPLSILNDWRRKVISKLTGIRIENYPRLLVNHKKTDHPYHQKELDYTFNVSNDLAQNFYQRHGAKVLENSFEQQENTMGKKIMTTKHCLRHFFGACSKNPEKDSRFKGSLFLVHNGKKYPLTFDCAKCVMEVWNQE